MHTYSEHASPSGVGDMPGNIMGQGPAWRLSSHAEADMDDHTPYICMRCR